MSEYKCFPTNACLVHFTKKKYLVSRAKKFSFWEVFVEARDEFSIELFHPIKS